MDNVRRYSRYISENLNPDFINESKYIVDIDDREYMDDFEVEKVEAALLKKYGSLASNLKKVADQVELIVSARKMDNAGITYRGHEYGCIDMSVSDNVSFDLDTFYSILKRAKINLKDNVFWSRDGFIIYLT
jgi:hypothetical protein